MTAKEYLEESRIYDDKTVYNSAGDIVGTLTQLMTDYHEGEVKTLGLFSVSNNEVAVCNCDKPKYVLNEVMQELQCRCGNRFKLQTDC